MHWDVAHAVDRYSGRKLGIASATYASQRSCPSSCPLRGQGCYAEQGPLGIHTRRLNASDPSADPDTIAHVEAEKIREIVSGRYDLRLHVVGDATTESGASILAEASGKVLRKKRRAWTYTHAWEMVDRASWGGVSVLASAETAEQVEDAHEKGYATALIVPEFQERKLYRADGLSLLPCPNQAISKNITCSDCNLCKDDRRLHAKGITIAFEAHGSRKNTVKRIVQERPLVQLGSL